MRGLESRSIGVRRGLAHTAVALAAAVLLLTLASPATQAIPARNWPWSLTRLIHAPFDMPFPSVDGLAVAPDASTLYVGTGAVVDQYSETGVWEQTWPARFNHVAGIATDYLGNVYVADSGAGQVQKFNAEGKHLATWSVPGVRKIATDTKDHVFLVVSVGIGEVVDVRSYFGVDEGAWSAVPPGSWFPPSPTSYSPATFTGIVAITTDAGGNVYLVGDSLQHLEGSGPDCSGVFEIHHVYEFPYADPLVSSEIAEFSPTGSLVTYGFDQPSSAACYPGWKSWPPYELAAVNPRNGLLYASVGVTIVEPTTFAGYIPGSLGRLEEIYAPGYGQEGVKEFPGAFEGPGAFDCHEDLYGSGRGEVIELLSPAPLACKQIPSKAIQELSIAPALRLTTSKVKKKKAGKAQALIFEAGCPSPGGCTIGARVRVRVPGCRGCSLLAGSGQLHLVGGRVNTLTLPLGGRGAKLLAHLSHPRLLLSARLMRHGHPFGRTFRPAGGALVALSASPLTLTCRAHSGPGQPLPVSGTLGVRGVHSLAITTAAGSVQTTHTVTTSAAGSFALTATAPTTGVMTVQASFAGSSGNAPSGAECGTEVSSVVRPAPPPPPGPPPPPTETHPKEAPPAASALTLKCRADVSQKFTGTLEPALGEAPITITYRYTPIGGVAKELVDTVYTHPDGSFEDEGPRSAPNPVKPRRAGRARAATWARARPPANSRARR